MLKHRLFNILIAIALVTVVALTVREAIATSIITSRGGIAKECYSLPSQYSIHSETVGTSARLTYTEDGPTGVDGGLVYLLSAYRLCAEKGE